MSIFQKGHFDSSEEDEFEGGQARGIKTTQETTGVISLKKTVQGLK